MGKLLSKLFGNKEMRILMLGLDAAGKTSILEKKKHNNNCRFHLLLLALLYNNMLVRGLWMIYLVSGCARYAKLNPFTSSSTPPPPPSTNM